MRNIIGTFAAILLIASGCTSLKNIQQSNIKGRKVEFATAGSESPTIVFETGMGQDINTWHSIFDSLSQHAKVFAYNRPGYGHSSLKNAPRNNREVAEQLHQDLMALGHPPPYLVVGHSIGGLHANMFARLYPDEVVGVVLLDSSHPDQFEYFREHQKLMYSILILSTKKGKVRYEESIVKSAQSDFITAPEFPTVPIVVLTAGKKSSPLETDKMRRKWLEFQNDLAHLSARSKHVIVKGSGHFIHKDKPKVVIKEIVDLLKSL